MFIDMTEEELFGEYDPFVLASDAIGNLEREINGLQPDGANEHLLNIRDRLIRINNANQHQSDAVVPLSADEVDALSSINFELVSPAGEDELELVVQYAAAKGLLHVD